MQNYAERPIEIVDQAVMENERALALRIRTREKFLIQKILQSLQDIDTAVCPVHRRENDESRKNGPFFVGFAGCGGCRGQRDACSTAEGREQANTYPVANGGGDYAAAHARTRPGTTRV